MATTSGVVTIKQRLVTVLDAALSIDVSYAPPFNPRGQSILFLGDVKLGRHDYPTMKAGRKAREESFTLALYVETICPGKDSSVAELEALSHLEALENEIANDPSIGLSGTDPTLRLQVANFALDTTVDENQRGWRSRVTVQIEVAHRLS